MSHLPDNAEATLAAMSEADVTELLARVRPEQESADPLERAAAALRRTRGLDRQTKATKQQAANAMADYRSRGN